MGYDFIGSRSERLAAERRVDRLREFGFIVLVVLLWAAAVMFFFTALLMVPEVCP